MVYLICQEFWGTCIPTNHFFWIYIRSAHSHSVPVKLIKYYWHSDWLFWTLLHRIYNAFYPFLQIQQNSTGMDTEICHVMLAGHSYKLFMLLCLVTVLRPFHHIRLLWRNIRSCLPKQDYNKICRSCHFQILRGPHSSNGVFSLLPASLPWGQCVSYLLWPLASCNLCKSIVLPCSGRGL